MPIGEVWRERLNLGSGEFAGIARSAGLSRWVCCGGPASGLQLVYSAEDADLDTWTPGVLSGVNQVRAVASDDASQFVICGYDRINFSSTGLGWSSYGVGGTPAFNSIAFGPTSHPGDLFLLAGDEVWRQNIPSVMSSWSQLDSAVTWIEDIAVNPTTQRWVGVGGTAGGIASYSDGGLATTWSSAEYALGSAPLRGVDFANGLFVAVGDNGQIFTSADGYPFASWTQRSSGTTESFRAIAWCGTAWIAVGLNGLVASSPDGITWSLQPSGVLNNLTAIAFDPVAQIALAAGHDGLILSSFEGDKGPGALNPSVTDPTAVGEEGGYLLDVYADFSDYLGQEFEAFIGPNGDDTDSPAWSGVPGRPNTFYPLNAQRMQVYTPLLEVGLNSIYFRLKNAPSVYGYLEDSITVHKRDFKTLQYQHRSVWAPIWYVGPRSIEQEDPV